MRLDPSSARFSKLGGMFVTPIGTLVERLMRTIRGFVCDWDGVFNQGAKGEAPPRARTASPTRWARTCCATRLWREHGDAADRGADHRRRESVGAQVRECASTSTRSTTARATRRPRSSRCAALIGVSSEQLVCIFDDVNDLGMAFACGIRVLVQRSASPLLREYVARQGLCDYVTAHPPRAARRARGLRAAARLARARSKPSSRRASPGTTTTRAYFAARQAIDDRSSSTQRAND